MVSQLFPLSRPILILFSLCLLGAGLGHVIQVWHGGWLPYRFAPLPLNTYWTTLTFLDPLAAVLLLWRPRTGLVLALLIIASDVAINYFARFYLGVHLGTIVLSLQLLFLVAVAAAMLYVRMHQTDG
ncbi:MAG TPA: hypothetical protein VNW72_11075 [Chthoniobacterales bacterium]|jgi:hypothetical protein|nr:hypothetical protein [Chthoniobacterales bacterium]